MLAAGRGIEAAHAAGLVHRDVKPRNILVGRDGRVRVVDFGLARSHGEGEDMLSTGRTHGDEPQRMNVSATGPLLDAQLTQTGSVIGTPAYMAPEQFGGGAIDHAADQFAFCVTAWEVLFGVRPFGGSATAMLLAIHDGEVERPADVVVPAALESALRKGLAHKVSRRHRDMQALLAVFEEALAQAKGAVRPPARSRRGWLLAGGLAIAASSAAFWLGANEAASCEGAEARFAGVWDVARKAEIERAMLDTSASFAGGAWTRLESNVDLWTSEWIAAHRDACEATRVRGEQSERLLDLRMSCLESRRVRMSAYLDLLASATPEVVANADDGFADLPEIERCADVEYVEHRGQRSEDPAIAAIEDEVLAAVARATTLHAAGDYEGALAIAEAAVGRASGAGSDSALAHALLAQGRSLAALHRPDEAFEVLADSYRIARTTGTDEVATEASRRAALTAGLALDRPDEGRWWIATALIEAKRSGTEEPVASARIAEARLLASAGLLPEARERLEAVIASLPPRTPLHADALRGLGSVEVRLGELDVGLASLVEARDIDEARLGPDHPALAENYGEEATALLERSELDDAYEAASRAVAIVEAAYGPDHIAVYPHLDNLANVTWERGDAELTLEIMRRARQMRRPTPLGPVAAARIASREAETLLGMGRTPEALAGFRAALDGSVAALGRWHHTTAARRLELATALAHDGAIDEALALVDEALASDTSSLGAKSSALMRMHDLAANALELSGKTERAAEEMRRAVEAAPDPTVASASNVKLHANLCGLERKAGRGQEAVAACKVALAQASALPGLSPLVRATVHNNACAAYSDTGMLDEAKAECLQGLRVQTRDGADADDMLAATVRSNIAEIDLRAGRARDAIDGYARSLATRERLAGARSATLLVPLRGLAQAHILAGDLAAATTVARRAVEISETTTSDPLARGHARMLLARALWSDARRRNESNRLAASAAKDFEAAGPRAETLRGDLEAWRAAPDTAELIPR